MTAGAGPVVRAMSRAECDALLTRLHVGRVAFSHHDHVDIEPIHYVYAAPWIYSRTAPGTKLRTLAHNRWVAFEVDETAGTFEWRSVVVKGALYRLTPDGIADGPYDEGVRQLRTIVPDAFTDTDPVPERSEVFRIHADQVEGRESSLGT